MIDEIFFFWERPRNCTFSFFERSDRTTQSCNKNIQKNVDFYFFTGRPFNIQSWKLGYKQVLGGQIDNNNFQAKIGEEVTHTYPTTAFLYLVCKRTIAYNATRHIQCLKNLRMGKV